MLKPKKNSFRYIPGLDGLRALAVLSVIGYHLNLPYFSGGFLGVTVFFVLSGFLITSLLTWEWDQTQNINIKHFWIRRAKRLLPAMFLLLIVLNMVVPLLKPELIANLRNDTIAAFFYYSNWHLIFQKISYFESFNNPSLLTHFWSLAIEEQFYIFWAVLVLLSFKWIKNRKLFFFLLVMTSLLSALLMYLIYEPFFDPSRVYYGTDTRLFSLLIGASAAILVPNKPQPKRYNKKKWRFEVMGLVGISSFIAMTIFTNQYNSFNYQGGMFLLSVTTVLLVLSLAKSSTIVSKWMLEWKFLNWIGVRSYGIYLWHYPIIILVRSNVDTNGLNLLEILVILTLSFLLAALSYTFIEIPIRRGRVQFKVKNSVLITVTLLLLIVFTNSNWINNIMVGASEREEVLSPVEEVISPIPVYGNRKDEGIRQAPKPVNKPIKQSKPPIVKPKPNPPVKENNTAPPSEKPPIITGKMTAIGDSVLINPAPYLKKSYPNIHINAKVSRQMRDANAIINQLKNSNQLGTIVIIALGTNGPFPEKTLTDLIDNIGHDKKILFVNTRVPRPWESDVNKMLENVSKKYTHITLVDWYSTSSNHNEYFVKDGVHLKPDGAKAYALMIEKAIKNGITSKN
jgi:peptidoglycan/LPS O-acetylase OafA/YrhL/lysophospholipase L1-like esterase